MGEDTEVETMELTWTAVEIDPEYEFDAARCFDFTREETWVEARDSELWFESAATYPPSPFVRRLILREDLMQENTSSKLRSNEAVTISLFDNGTDIGMNKGSSEMETGERDYDVMNGGSLAKFQNLHRELPTDSTFYNAAKDTLKAKPKLSMKPRNPRTSTLMKPTASQLAKQNQPLNLADTRNLMNPLGVEGQAAKRQKLEGGLVHKVPDLKPQNNFIHKASKKELTNDGLHVNLKLTIPREPELETAHRAQRTRPKITSEPERTTFRRFKALPLNKKILDAPSLLLPKRTIPRLPEFQEFHFKTSERAMQHASSIPSSLGSCGNTDKVFDKTSTNAIAESTSGEPKRSNLADASKHGGYDFVHSFKARPLNKKIFSSKGDIGVYRNIKKDVTVPLEFNFQTDKRGQHHPPIELFDKLSLAELQINAVCHGKLPQPSSIHPKGPKENRMSYFQPAHETNSYHKEKPRRFWKKQPQSRNNGDIFKGGQGSSVTKSTGMR